MSFIFIITYLLLMSAQLRAELIQNPAASSTTTCGETEDCTIICDADSFCEDATFSVKNNAIHIECAAHWNSCDGLKITATDVTSLNITLHEFAFNGGVLRVVGDTGRVTVQCLDFSACSRALFYYEGGSPITHICDGNLACQLSLIYASTPISLYCGPEPESCERNTFVMAMNPSNYSSSSVHILTSILDFYIFSVYRRHITTICDACSGWIVYGPTFDDYCDIKDTECVQQALNAGDDSEVQVFDTGAVQYGSSFDLSDVAVLSVRQQAIGGTITADKSILILLSEPDTFGLYVYGQTFYPPALNGDELYVTVLCVVCSPSPDFDFRQTRNVNLVIAGWFNELEFSTIYGPMYQFSLQNHGTGRKTPDLPQIFYLNDTEYVTFHGLPESTIQLETNRQVDIQCTNIRSFPACTKTDIYSSLDPQQLSLSRTGWSIDCSGGCTEFFIHFEAINTICSYNGSEPIAACLFLTAAPTSTPTATPSNAPTVPPTNAPTGTPSKTPSNAPTVPPTLAPSLSPVDFPTKAPTDSPTRFPTSDDVYSQSQKMLFMIRNMSESNQLFLEQKGEAIYKEDIASIIEEAVVFSAEGKAELGYKDFDVLVDKNNLKYNRFRNDYVLKLTSTIYYKEEATINTILFILDQSRFLDEIRRRLAVYFGDSEFFTFSAAPIEQTDADQDEIEYDPVMYGLLVFMIFMVLGSLAALTFNKKETKVDNAQWRVFMILGLQIADLISDLNLNIEMLVEFGKQNKNENETYLYVAGIGSLLFIVISYITNIAIAANVKKIVSDNNAAVAFFEQRAGFFILLVVFSGSAYSVLALFSSRIFALDLFNCGLTLYEMRQLSKIKIFASVLLENVPQLIFQVFYTLYLGTPSNNTYLSFTSSFLSIVIAVLTHFVDSKSSECYIAQYDLQLGKKGGVKLSNDEKKQIVQKKECKEALRTLISSAIKIEESHLELGHITITSNGLVIKMVHYIFKNELDSFKTNDDEDNDVEEDKMYQRLTKQFTFELYSVHNAQVKDAFLKHFQFEKADSFRVKYFEKFGYQDMLHKSKGNVLRRLVSVIEMDQYTDDHEEDLLSEKYKVLLDLGAQIYELSKQEKSASEMKSEFMRNGFKENDILSVFILMKVHQETVENTNS